MWGDCSGRLHNDPNSSVLILRCVIWSSVRGSVWLLPLLSDWSTLSKYGAIYYLSKYELEQKVNKIKWKGIYEMEAETKQKELK